MSLGTTGKNSSIGFKKLAITSNVVGEHLEHQNFFWISKSKIPTVIEQMIVVLTLNAK